MKNRLIPYVLTFLFVILSLPEAKAQFPWKAKKNSKYLHIATSGLQYNRLLLNGNQQRELKQSITDMSFILHGEYSLKEGLTLSMTLPYKVYKIATGDSASLPYLRPGYFKGVGNIDVGIRSLFFDYQNFEFYGYFKVQLPTILKDYSRGLRTGVDAISLIPGFLMTKSWPKFQGHLFTEFHVRDGSYSDSFFLQAKALYQVRKRMWVGVHSDWFASFRNGYVPLTSLQQFTGSYVNNQEFFLFGLTSSVELNRITTFHLGVTATAWGHLIGQSPAVHLGLSMNW